MVCERPRLNSSVVSGGAFSRTLDERMEPGAASEPRRRKAAEFLELRDHVGLIGITELDCGLRPVHACAPPCAGETRLEPGKPAIQLGRNADVLTKQARQVLARNARGVCKTLYCHFAGAMDHRRGQSGYVHF